MAIQSLSALQNTAQIDAFELGDTTDIFLSGRFLGLADFGDALGTLSPTADQFFLSQFKATRSFTMNEIGLPVTAVPLLTSPQVKFVIYEASQTNAPSTLVYQSAPVTMTAAGYAAVPVNFTFSKSKRYWVGCRFSAAMTVRVISLAGLPSLGYATNTATAAATILRRTLAFATAAPALFTIAGADFVSSTMPDIRLRIA